MKTKPKKKLTREEAADIRACDRAMASKSKPIPFKQVIKLIEAKLTKASSKR